MFGYFKIPIKNGYIDIDKQKDTPLKIYYQGDFGYVFLEYTQQRDNWFSISENEFITVFPSTSAPFVPYQPTNAEVAQLLTDIRVDLFIAGVIDNV